ncbi:hypothetical protein PACTADRAFT_78554 [Pachysolen tannophilus NRRL Y-2460]|uniref:Large ribosomal subunit protein mL60 n=1 Tax=Pachysolen tannophilus NRRL Y-2460 TaxID=669874 RepID=A0A1E4U2D0_PACTA|nr:hypothetical protein PACTADRAFT_78554 [Pachysolen tannophilus NRRL Y-2460]
MFGPFRQSAVALGGLLWKRPWRMSNNQKYRLRKRMQLVDQNIENLYKGLAENNLSCKAVDFLKNEFPKESEMLPKNKYTVFNKTSRNYRKGVHLVPKWTKKSLRENPEFF